ncbi:diacylglycerol/lipid kinase family protein [Rubritalea marina]|uniref:diacylglycerol/lipid kinase family protein n=1 Tax=Rubritalea marina TaxID=361055 RepID=UPI0009FE7052|nr:diacylglycerol kinase family protein [Rubritalea marina]
MNHTVSQARYPLLFNPNARSQKGRRALRFLMSHAQDFVLYATRDADDARDLASDFARSGEPIVLAAGGDGTLNAVIHGLGGSQTALGVLPAGTMNVFAREMGIPVPNMQTSNLKKALEIIQAGFIREVDLFEANGQAFVQMAGVGFDAQVIEETTSEMKNLFGPMSYLMSAVKVLGDQPPSMTVRCADGRVFDGVAVLVGNGSLYGGQMKLFPNASNEDNMLDLLIFKESGYKLVLDSIKGMAGVIDLVDSSVEYVQADEFTVTSNREVPIEIDGEYAGRATEVAFSPAKNKLKVLAPEGQEGGLQQLWNSWMNLHRKIVEKANADIHSITGQSPK